MSDTDALTERDEAVLGVIDEQMDTIEETTDDADDEIAELRGLCRDLAERLDTVESRQDTADRHIKELQKNLQRLTNRVEADGSRVAGQTDLERYATAPEQMREDLPANKLRAVMLYEDWAEISWRYDANEGTGQTWFVDTATRKNSKNMPSRLKHELETRCGTSLQWNDVYRTMQHMARMSGGEEEVDEHGRTHIVGGDYEYHERPTSDNSKMKRVLVEVTR